MQSLYIFVGNFIYLFAQWALTVVAVRFGDYQIAGVLGLAMTITNIFYIIAGYGLRAYQVSDIQKRYSDQCYILSRAVTVGAALLACAVYLLFSGYASGTLAAIMLYMVYKCFEAASDVTYGIFQNNDRCDYICLSMGAKGVVSFAVFTLALARTGSVVWAMLAMAVVSALTFVFLDMRWCGRFVKPLMDLSRKAWSRMGNLLWVAAPMVLYNITQPLLLAIPRLYFEQHYSTELLGAYTSVSSPTQVITTFVSCVMMPYIPRFARYYFGGDRRRLYRLTFLSMAFAAGVGAAALAGGRLLGEWALALLYGEEIRAYFHVFLLIIVVTTFSSVLMCLGSLFVAIRKLRTLSAIMVGGCLLCWAITPHFVGVYAMEGVTYSLMLAQAFQLAMCLLMAVLYIRKTPQPADEQTG